MKSWNQWCWEERKEIETPEQQELTKQIEAIKMDMERAMKPWKDKIQALEGEKHRLAFASVQHIPHADGTY